MPDELWREKPEWCDFCGWETKELKLTGEQGVASGPQWLCDLCRDTLAGNVALHPTAYNTDVTVLKTVIRIGHMLLEHDHDPS
ncbi:hypothetical protein LCGC14_3037150 [marine sediment metagenome]|uniref:Uncharacterized protein n=1 Tax=marine sediment metagenome TaxID=412755 RepID=A0A0F8ZGM4_9ZZZZ